MIDSADFYDDAPQAPPPGVAAILRDAAEYDPDAEAYDAGPCPDVVPADGRYGLDAYLVEARHDQSGQPIAWRRRRYDRAALEDQLRLLAREADVALRPLREGPGGGLDLFAHGAERIGWGGRLTGQYLPMMPGPASRAMLWNDYMGMTAKAFEAYHHNPLAHRAVEGITEFTLGRGVQWRFAEPTAKDIWERFWNREQMDAQSASDERPDGMPGRFEEMAGDLSVYGELFLRYLPREPGHLTVRSLDPSSIYEIVSDAEDWETTLFYHQQFQPRQQLVGAVAPTYVIRQVLPAEIDHYRVNVRSQEPRGRSDLYSVLGWLKRHKDLLTSQVVKEDMLARMVWKVMAKGNAGEVNALIARLFPGNRPPSPGSVLGVNAGADVEAMNFSGAGSDSGSSWVIEAIVNMVAIGTGVSKEYLGITGESVRASALVATEPAAKRFERRQRLLERILVRMKDRVLRHAGHRGSYECEFIFPSIATEDRSAKLADLRSAEEQHWLSRETCANMAAREFDITSYDYADEQKKIEGEREEAMQRAAARTAVMTPAGDGEQAKEEDVEDEDRPPGRTRGGLPADQNVSSANGRATVTRQAREAASPPRRDPHDPEFQAEAEEYLRQARGNLDRLVIEVVDRRVEIEE